MELFYYKMWFSHVHVCVLWCVFRMSTKKCDNQKHVCILHFENHTSASFPLQKLVTFYKKCSDSDEGLRLIVGLK